MGQPSMRITVDAAMRAREVSRPLPEGVEPPSPPPAEPAAPRSGKAAKNERRRLNKRGGGAARQR